MFRYSCISFPKSIPRFEKELANSSEGVQGDAVKINYLKRTLNNALKTQLIGQLNLLQSYLKYANILLRLNANLNNLQYYTKKKPKSQLRLPPSNQKTIRPRAPLPAKATVNIMDQKPTRISQAIHKANKKLKGKRAKQVKQNEINRRRSEGRYFRYGRTKYQVSKYPLLPARRPNNKTRVVRFNLVLKA